MAYDTPQRREAAARAAGADVQMQADAQRQATMRNMERSGALPSSGKVMALNGMMDIGVAKAKAGAANIARQDVENKGQARLMDAANVGRSVAGTQATQAGIGLNASRSGVASGVMPLDIANSGATLMGQGFGGARAGLAAAGGLQGQIAGINQQKDAAKDQQMGQLGSAAMNAALRYFMS
jgi:hypothetical protein